MSEIDWSKAPEGFPLWLEFKAEAHRMHSGWYRKDGNYFKGHYGAHWPEYRTGQFFNVHYKSEKHLINDAYLAPLSPSPAWSGEGLPPVGLVLEYMWNYKPEGSEYVQVEILVHDKGSAIMRTLDGPDPGVLRESRGGNCGKGQGQPIFRPIRTPEQVRAELANQAIKEIAKIICRDGAFDIDDPEVTESAVALYDAGLRFTEPAQ